MLQVVQSTALNANVYVIRNCEGAIRIKHICEMLPRALDCSIYCLICFLTQMKSDMIMKLWP